MPHHKICGVEVKLSWDDRHDIEEVLGASNVREYDDYERAANEAEKKALEILRLPSVLAQFVRDVGKGGLIGEQRNALALFVTAVSRLREKPLSVLVKGSSSSGKNFLVKSILRFLPRECVHEISSMSERSLNFMSQSELAHTILYFYEIDGRSRSVHPNRLLLSEGKLVHWYTTSSGRGSRETRGEVTGGPVACISTTTEDRLKIDDESRHLSLWLDESADQTRRIAAAYGAEISERIAPKQVLAWIAVQKLLETRRDWPVEAPDWLSRIVDFMPMGDVRIRRYWPAFVEACKTICLIHSFHRDDLKSKKPRDLKIHFGDFAVANLIFDEILAKSLARDAEDDDVRTAEMVARIGDERGLGKGVEAANLVHEPGVASIDKAYRLLQRAERAGTIVRANGSGKNNLKLYVRAPDIGFVGNPQQVYNRIGERKPVEFIHPFSGALVRYGPKSKN
jgi:hypothetical protein